MAICWCCNNLGGVAMTPLVDGDVLLHELGWSGQFPDKDTKEVVLFQFEKVQEMLDDKIKLICNEVGATEPPIFFFSDNQWLADKEDREYIPNFRYEVATIKPYKGTRKNPKPFHFYNILWYLMTEHLYIISDNGLEADDEMALYQTLMTKRGLESVICSRDKDLRMVEGWHYSWECGKQHSVGPTQTDRIGWLEKKDNGDVLGYGLSFFFYQMIVGDSADNIAGLKGKGKAYAWNLLNELKTEEEMLEAVKNVYKETLGKESKDHFMENMKLLWMQTERGKYYV